MNDAEIIEESVLYVKDWGGLSGIESQRKWAAVRVPGDWLTITPTILEENRW